MHESKAMMKIRIKKGSTGGRNSKDRVLGGER